MKITIVPLLPAVAALTLNATLVSCASGGGSGFEPTRDDLTGTWLLNDLESDDAREFFAGPGEVDPALPGGNRQRVAERVSGILVAARVFRIEQSDSTVTIVLHDGTEVMFHPDNREIEHRIEGLGFVTTRARWRGDRFQVVRKLEGGSPTLTTTYELRNEGRKLFVRFNMSSPGRSPTRFVRVYDRAQR
jgi:hypothetical protein